MRPPVGLPSGMDPFALDAGTAERLLTGAVDAGDAPPDYRAVARILNELRSAPDSVEWAGDAAAVERIAAAVVVYRRRTRRERRTRRSASLAARLAAAVGVIGAVCVTGAFASAGTLPQPVQHAASTVLGTVGISVPSGGEEPTGAPPPTVASTTPPAPTGPSHPTARAPGAGAAPAASSSSHGPGDGRTEVRGDQGDNTPPGKANGHDKTHPSDGQNDGSSPLGRENDNER